MLLQGDCLVKLKELADNSIDSIVSDPPYGLSFMGKKWDYDVPSTEIWAECLRVLKPGGHLLAFFGTRTYHRGVVRIEDAGFEIRDQIMWIYGSGFPKSHDVSKGIDKQAGAEREVVGTYTSPEGTTGLNSKDDEYGFGVGDMSKRVLTAPATDAAKQWQGWGTALKPANEPIVVARKPLEKGLTIAENVLKWSTGALNIDASRIGARNDETRSFEVSTESQDRKGNNNYCLSCLPDKSSSAEFVSEEIQNKNVQQEVPFDFENGSQQSSLEERLHETGRLSSNPSEEQNRLGTSAHNGKLPRKKTNGKRSGSSQESQSRGQSSREFRACGKCGRTYHGASLASLPKDGTPSQSEINTQGRWPANVLFDEEAASVLDAQSGTKPSNARKSKANGKTSLFGSGSANPTTSPDDSGGASRFFKTFKKSKDDLALEQIHQTQQINNYIREIGACTFLYQAKASKRERNKNCGELLIWENVDQNLLDLTEELNSHLKDMSDITIQNLKDFEWSMILCGKESTDQSCKDFKFTMSTVSKLIIELKTSKFSQHSSIKENILDVLRMIEANGLSLAESAEILNQYQHNTISEKTESVRGVSLAVLQTLSKIRGLAKLGNVHSTVKPIKLMEYLINLVTPPNGNVLDPFMGSGSTGVAAKNLNRAFIGIELSEEYFEIAKKRLS